MYLSCLACLRCRFVLRFTICDYSVIVLGSIVFLCIVYLGLVLLCDSLFCSLDFALVVVWMLMGCLDCVLTACV